MSKKNILVTDATGYVGGRLAERLLSAGYRFGPRGLYGIFYWYSLLPAHDLLFRGMLKAITNKVGYPIIKGPETFKPGPVW